jgi:hypothetical protein
MVFKLLFARMSLQITDGDSAFLFLLHSTLNHIPNDY